MSAWDPFEHRREVVGERYRLSSLLGEGGAGSVHRATDLRSGAEVAVKLVEAPALSAPLRFIAEARDMARLRHPRVVRVLDAGRDGSWYWMAMELMAGSLKSRVEADGPLSPAVALTRIYEVLQGLHAVHALAIVHRDIKPHNVLLDQRGQARIADFGLARHETGHVPYRTLPGESLGTPSYRAPEQGRNASQAGPSADLYGAGAVLYFAVTGRRPTFFYMMDDTEYARETEGVPPSVAALIRRAMAMRPDERYATAKDMAEALGEAFDALPEHAGRRAVAPSWADRFERTDPEPTPGLWQRLRGFFSR